LADAAARVVDEDYSMPAYRRKVAAMYDWIEENIGKRRHKST